MNGHERFEDLARRARADDAPSPDVSARVMRTISGLQTVEAPGGPRWALQAALFTATLIGVAALYRVWEGLLLPVFDWTLMEWWLI